MKYINKREIAMNALPGRGLVRAIGKQSCFDSDNMTVGYALYNADYGAMDPHNHAEETVIITKANEGWIFWGDKKNHLNNKLKLEEGMILHIPEHEWHVFTYEEGGSIEIIFIYGKTDNLRPEDK